MSLKPLDVATAREILDFTGGDPALESLGELQLEGAVALHNMIADPNVGIGYLADEVGMGKTYVALGVISLMRYFNPSLRVLYICPSNNVQEKWYAREYRSFAKHNVKVSQYRVRTMDGRSAVPAQSCRNIPDLLHTMSLGYFADIFVGMSSFSLALTEDEDQWRRKLDELKQLIPAFELPKRVSSKQSVKEQYAATLNYVLPTFDLVVIDEAHNLKHDFESSDRNKVLSTTLGFREGGKYRRVKSALLLSATPYDRNIEHLRNQLKLVGHEHLLPAEVSNDEHALIESHLRKFMVRRLNELQVAGKPHTRNMYRREWRRGDHAEIALETDEQKLVTALVQKKVGEMLDKQGGSPSFQMGLLASFESYAESTRSGPVEFDGDVREKESTDAADRHVIGAIQDSYTRADLGRTLPHPKMDIVAQRLAEQMFHHNRKQIVFVRRVKSVKELKNKLDDHYTEWISNGISESLAQYPAQRDMMKRIIQEYELQSRQRDEDISGGDFRQGSAGETEDRQPPKKDNLFAWFFRGECPAEAEPFLVEGNDSYTTPDAMRIGLTAKNQVISSLLEINWARTITRLEDKDLQQLIDTHGEEIVHLTKRYALGQLRNDQLEIYEASQLAFLHWYSDYFDIPGIMKIVNHFAPREQAKRTVEISTARLADALNTHTLLCALHHEGLQEQLFPELDGLVSQLISGDDVSIENLQAIEIHKNLLSLCLRTGHGVVDLYLSRLKLGTANLTAKTRAKWMTILAKTLREQANSSEFNTYAEIHDLANNLRLILKNNLPDAYERDREEYRQYLSRALNPIAPIIGATGETVSTRSAQARKFRMPGYPLALISTDVFQEGEDLHTFCDSVMHYGLASSPVGIEQKTGRVDRVGSKAQRRLLQLDEGEDVEDQQLIQVTFPFVRESIEVLQVRTLCRNLNEFIKSLHKVGDRPIAVTDIIDTERELIDASPIPEQIRSRLTSPYVAQVDRRKPQLNREKFIREQAAHMDRVTGHVTHLLERHFDGQVFGEEGLYLDYPDGSKRNVRLRLRSARASGELLLSAEVLDKEFDLFGMDHRQLKNQMLNRSWHTFHRTYAVPIAARQYQLHHDAELLVGDEHSTTAGEISKFLERFSETHDPVSCTRPQSNQTLEYWKRADRKGNSSFGQWKADVTAYEYDDGLGLIFTFGDADWSRSHYINIVESAGRCIFLAQAASPDVVRGLSVEQLVKLTWERNRHIDIVEFMLDDELSLMGRAIHPVSGMTYREFMYCAYTLAVSTDRLEFLIREQDIH
ncbi:DEAD/DEAH box helicase family protein [bacterium]|nr:DEAD/DEAH box helicase family protein [bacterium]